MFRTQSARNLVSCELPCAQDSRLLPEITEVEIPASSLIPPLVEAGASCRGVCKERGREFWAPLTPVGFGGVGMRTTESGGCRTTHAETGSGDLFSYTIELHNGSL